LLIGHDELDVPLFTDRNEQAAEINPFPSWIWLPCIPRTTTPTKGLAGLRWLIIERLIVPEIVAVRLLITFLRPSRPDPLNVC
jgi:hypothetical protein